MLHITLYITQAALAITLIFMWINLENFRKMRKQALDIIDVAVEMYKKVDEESKKLKESSDHEISRLHQEFELVKKLSEQYRFKCIYTLNERLDDFEDKLEARFPNK